MGYSQAATAFQFFLYGKRHFTKTGYGRHAQGYKQTQSIHHVDLKGKVFMVTGANAGLGKEITLFLAGQGARVQMVCRDVERGEKARSDILQAEPEADLHLQVVDCSLERDVRRCWQEFSETGLPLDGLVCNAGALLNQKTLTFEGVEVTLAAHLLFGAYLLGSLAMPALAAQNGRLILVSSGGMYNTKFPDWDTACSLKGAYDGTLAYSYMKRGQVLLAERWAQTYPAVKVVSCHPGWASTDGVDKAFREVESILEPMRSTWQGVEGMCWLLACPLKLIQSGAFYLDREPQVKHIAGPFFTEGSFTKNTAEEVDYMMHMLGAWSAGADRPLIAERFARHEAQCARWSLHLRQSSSELAVHYGSLSKRWILVARAFEECLGESWV